MRPLWLNGFGEPYAFFQANLCGSRPALQGRCELLRLDEVQQPELHGPALLGLRPKEGRARGVAKRNPKSTMVGLVTRRGEGAGRTGDPSEGFNTKYGIQMESICEAGEGVLEIDSAWCFSYSASSEPLSTPTLSRNWKRLHFGSAAAADRARGIASAPWHGASGGRKKSWSPMCLYHLPGPTPRGVYTLEVQFDYILTGRSKGSSLSVLFIVFDSQGISSLSVA